MRFVLDASIAASWCFDDEDDPVANSALDMLEGKATAVAPALFWFELRNAALVGLRRGRIDSENLKEILARVARAAIDLAHLPDEDAVFTLAHRHRLTFYDAVYLELAQREGIALATLDGALARAAVAEGVPLIGAA